ncbi:hypothetical protein [Sphingomonas sp.]|uniref:hypothetical protein n=1 Tax=Sphingomonas sp. TaxID=28214 RepID=UPI00286CF108|nr:hypothetical protein [Sphingomonas sp.]
MTLAKIFMGLAVGFCATSVSAENWVTVFDDDQSEIWMAVDKDSVHRGADGLVYFVSDGPDKADRAADCNSRTLYTLKLYVMDGIAYPNWRNEGRAVVTGSAGEAEFQYACANA